MESSGDGTKSAQILAGEIMAKLNVVLWEDYLWKNFFPITLTHPVFELRSGIFSALERAKAFFPDARFYALCRKEIQPLVEEVGIGRTLRRGQKTS